MLNGAGIDVQGRDPVPARGNHPPKANPYDVPAAVAARQIPFAFPR